MNITVNYTTVTGVLSYVLDASNIPHWEQTHIYYTTMTELLKFTIEHQYWKLLPCTSDLRYPRIVQQLVEATLTIVSNYNTHVSC